MIRAAVAAVSVLMLATGPAAAQAPGEGIEVRAQDLPAPYQSQSVGNSPETVGRPEGTVLAVPQGFTASIFAEGLIHPREMEVLPSGDVLLAEPRAGRITLLRDADGDGRAEGISTFAAGLSAPHGMELRPDGLYVADLVGVWRLAYRPGATAAGGPPQQITPRGAFGIPDGHWSRTLVFHPDGSRFYVAIGSQANIEEEAEPRATIQEFRADGSGQRTFAAGLRNPVGIAFQPGTQSLFAVVNERDGLGDRLVPDYLTQVADGGFYGWPYAYIGPNPQPGFADRRPDLVAATVVPDLLFESHSAPLGLVFYQGDQFPADYRGDAFVALHGSWNRADPAGYFVARVPFEDGRPAGGYEVFASGFRIGGTGRARVWGRPAGVAVAADGALLIADDTGGTVWRVAFEGSR
ncbi:MAG: PQQ-dependent sugar dehydrogenase [Rhodospirillaceae bacterium]|nr:PQQ-dependent sugar dehydrogenase [Rhodospirillaceae bacterium]